MKTKFPLILIFLSQLFVFSQITFVVAQSKTQVAFTLEDRDRMIRMEIRQEEMMKRFDQSDKCFEQIDKRFEQIDNRFIQIDNRFLQIDARMQWQFGILISALFMLFGFILWVRRTYLKPFEHKVNDLKMAFENKDSRIENVISSLRELAKTDSKVAEVLKSFNLL